MIQKTKQLRIQVRFGGLLLLGLSCNPAWAEPGVGVNVFVQLSKKVVPAVVNISTFAKVRAPSPQGTPDDFFRFFEGFFGEGFQPPGFRGPQMRRPGPKREPQAPVPRAMSLGTGFIIDRSGLILTNHHVVAQADEIKVSFTEQLDEKPVDAEVIGQDAELDVALLKVKTKRELEILPLGDSDALEVGEYVMAVGNPFSQGHTVTHGIISAKDRIAQEQPFTRYLQTDAPINPGNSGGPLLNLSGAVIGINNAIDPRAHGIGFAIPINAVKSILPQLKTRGRVSRGYVGVLVAELSPEMAPELAAKLGARKGSKGVFVTNVEPGQPAEKAGVQNYDVISEVNGKVIQSTSDLIGAVTSIPVGEEAKLKINRAGKEMTLSVKVAERPSGQVRRVAPDRSKKGEGPKKKSRFNTGMQLEKVTPDLAKEWGFDGKSTGILITQIEYGSPADRAGLQRGEIILDVDRKSVADPEYFESVLEAGKSHLLRLKKLDPEGREIFRVVILNLQVGPASE